MIFTWLLFILIFIQDETPFKPKEEFEVKLNYSFKKRPAPESTTFRFDDANDREKQNSSSMLPYLILDVKILSTSPTEARLKVIDNLNNKTVNKKIYDDFMFSIDMGFTDDVKDHVTAHQYIVYLLNDKREEQSKIVIFVKEDGAFLINDEVRGKL
ncbi:MAG: hypothetical protein ABI663_22130 [Chryseolinea sp.]